MKTKLQITGIALLGFIFTSCSSSMYMSNSSVAPTDDIYYTPNKSTNITPRITPRVESTSIDNSQNISSSKYAQLEKEYANKNDSDTLTIKSDTLAAKYEEVNPYDRILSDSYEDSYQRRLKGRENPWYGIESPFVYYSDDYWFASAFDPSIYNIIIMGDQVWVEPKYISSMFAWPRINYSFSIGSGYTSWGWNAMYDSPFYYNISPWNYNPFAFSSYYNSYYNSPYCHNFGGYNPLPNYYWNNNHFSGNEHYGRRNSSLTSITTTGRLAGISYENQIASSHRSDRTTTFSGVGRNGKNFTRDNQTTITKRDGQGNQVVIGRDNRNTSLNTTRLRNEATTRTINMSEPTRRNNSNGNYQKPRSTNNTDYIRTGTRNQNMGTSNTIRDNNSRSTSTVRENRNTTNTYNRPSRVSTATSRDNSSSSGSSLRGSSNTRSSGSSYSGSSSRDSRSSTSSGSGSSSGSSGSSSNGGSGSGGDRGKR